VPVTLFHHGDPNATLIWPESWVNVRLVRLGEAARPGVDGADVSADMPAIARRQ
jgi:hypothetical protein